MTSRTTISGIGLAGWVFIALLVLKLIPGTVVYDWSWWWVTLPLWIGPLVAIVFFALFLFGWYLIKFFKWAHYGK